MNSKRKTAAELLEELRSDSSYILREQSREKARLEAEEVLAKEEAPLVEALRSRGIDVRSVWDLIGLRASYAAGIPVLVDHLRHNYPDRIREGILRALATSEAKIFWRDLLNFFEENSLSLSPELRYMTAVVLNGAADDSVIDDVIRLVRDDQFGLDRMPLLYTLQRSDSPAAKMLLHELRTDPILGKEVKRIRRLKRMKLKGGEGS